MSPYVTSVVLMGHFNQPNIVRSDGVETQRIIS
jgi:hypothetical protein